MSIAANHVNHRYGTKVALSDVCFQLEAGQFGALLGLNGAGKSTLFSLLTRLIALQQGDLSLCGESLQQQPRSAMRALGVVFQQSTLDLDLTVEQNLIYHACLHGMEKQQRRQRINEELARIGLDERRHDKVRQLNGGHRRRIEIARALLHQPDVLLLDEPTVGLDIDTRHGINQYVRQRCENHHLCVLWATHLIDEVQQDDHVILLHQGRILSNSDGHHLCSTTQQPSLQAAFQQITRQPQAA